MKKSNQIYFFGGKNIFVSIFSDNFKIHGGGGIALSVPSPWIRACHNGVIYYIVCTGNGNHTVPLAFSASCLTSQYYARRFTKDFSKPLIHIMSVVNRCLRGTTNTFVFKSVPVYVHSVVDIVYADSIL